jgi:hypothetical protein
MTPSSRTPEGQPNRCPFCKKAIRIEPSSPLGDAPCPHCGCLIWFDPACSSDVDWNLIENTKNQIREKVQRIAELGQQTEIGGEKYIATFLPDVVSCLAAKAGAIWMRSTSTLELTYCVNREIVALRENRFRDRHELLVQTAFRSGESMRVPPGEDYGVEAGGNPTDFLLLLSPIKVIGKIVAIVEIFQRTEAGVPTQRGYQRFLTQMCEMAGNSLAFRSMEQVPLVQTRAKTTWWKFWK